MTETPQTQRVGTTYDGHPRYQVTVGGQVVGFIEGHNPTFERSSPGKRYVNARWTSRRRYWKTLDTTGRVTSRENETIKRALWWFERVAAS